MESNLNIFEMPKEKREEGNFNFLGRLTTQQPDGSVHVTTQNYLNDVKPIFVTKPRRAESHQAVTSMSSTAGAVNGG